MIVNFSVLYANITKRDKQWNKMHENKQSKYSSWYEKKKII